MSEPRADFWCVVALDDHGDVWIIRRSHDAIVRDVLMEFAAEDNGMDLAWCKGRTAGLYRLNIKPWGVQSFDGEYDTGVDVADVVPLYELPASIEPAEKK